MAAVVPGQFYEYSLRLSQDIVRVRKEQIEQNRTAYKQLAQFKPVWVTREFLVKIPYACARLTSSIALSILFAPFALLCGRYSLSKIYFKKEVIEIKYAAKEIPWLFLGVICPRRVIDPYSNLQTRFAAEQAFTQRAT